MSESDARLMTDVIWSYWKELRIEKPAMTWIELYQIVLYVFKEARERGIDPQEIDIRAETDARLGYYENREHFKKILGAIAPVSEVAPPISEAAQYLAYTLEELDRLLESLKDEKAEIEVLLEKHGITDWIKEKETKLERKAEQLERRYNELRFEREKERRESAEKIKQLERELAEAPTIKLRILRDFREGVIDFRTGQIVETKNRGWALAKIKEGSAEEVTPEVPITPLPPKPKELTEAEQKRLQDQFEVTLNHELGRIPRNALGEFRLELDTVKNLPYEQALESIMALAREIIRRERAPPPHVPRPPPERIVEVGIPEEERPPIFRRWRTSPIPKPLSPLPFPRAPAGGEFEILWKHFEEALTGMRKRPIEYSRAFDERMKHPFRNWESLIQTYLDLLNDIQAGREIAFISLVTRVAMPWREDTEENWRSDAISHFTSIRLYKTIDELIYSPHDPPGLEAYGVTGVTPEEVKQVIKKAWKEKSHWFITTPKEWLEAFIGEPLE